MKNKNSLMLIMTIFLLSSFALSAAPASNLTEDEKILKLYDAILNAEAVFIRNGSEHTAREAVDHLKMKRDYAGDRIKTARQFINYLATKSSISGSLYYVKLTDGSKVPSGQWLHARLRKIESG